MFANIDIKFDGYQKWVQEMQGKVEERKKKKPAGGDQRALLRTPSVRAFLPSLGTSSSLLPTSQTQTQSPQHTNSSTTPSPAAATASGSGSNIQSSQPSVPALTRRNTPTNAAMMAASLSTSLGLQKFTECTELERSFTRLKLTINPLFLMRKKLQLAQELQQQQQQQEAAHVSRPPPAYPPPPPPPAKRSSLGTLSLMNQNHGSSSSLLNGTGPGIQPIPHNPSPQIVPSPSPPSSGAAPSSTTSTPAQPT
jgi:hypothetical protein